MHSSLSVRLFYDTTRHGTTHASEADATRHTMVLTERRMVMPRASAGRYTALVEREEPPPQAERLPIDYVPVLYEGCLVGFSVRSNTLHFIIFILIY